MAWRLERTRVHRPTARASWEHLPVAVIWSSVQATATVLRTRRAAKTQFRHSIETTFLRAARPVGMFPAGPRALSVEPPCALFVDAAIVRPIAMVLSVAITWVTAAVALAQRYVCRERLDAHRRISARMERNAFLVRRDSMEVTTRKALACLERALTGPPARSVATLTTTVGRIARKVTLPVMGRTAEWIPLPGRYAASVCAQAMAFAGRVPVTNRSSSIRNFRMTPRQYRSPQKSEHYKGAIRLRTSVVPRIPSHSDYPKEPEV